MNLFRPLVMFLFLIAFIQSNGQITEKHFHIYSVKLDKEVTLSDIADDMKNT